MGTPDRQSKLQRFKFALRLVESLYHLYSGPWMQKPWDSSYIHLMQNNETESFNWVDGAYIACNIGGDRAHHRFHGGAESVICPPFFLSLARTLMEIGTEPRNQPKFDDFWYTTSFDFLRQEQKRMVEDCLLESYSQAVEGCLLFSHHHNVERQYTTDDNSAARNVIRDQIIDPLLRNIQNWDVPPTGDEELILPDSLPGHTCSRDGPYRRRNPPAITLWSNIDDNFKIMCVLMIAL